MDCLRYIISFFSDEHIFFESFQEISYDDHRLATAFDQNSTVDIISGPLPHDNLNKLEFDESEFNQIKKIFPESSTCGLNKITSGILKYSIFINTQYQYQKKTYVSPNSHQTLFADVGIEIKKMSDEWYYISYYFPYFPHAQDTGYIRYKPYFYKCDQFDGLLQCLQFIKSNYFK